MAQHTVDVFIAGAGPVGLVLAYQLTRLGLSVYIIDAADKSSPDFPMYGRACTLYPGSLEIMDRFDLYEDLAQVGYVSKQRFTYADGQRVQGRGWKGVDGISGLTHFDYILNIRLKYSEDIFRAKLADKDVQINAPTKLLNFNLDPKVGDDYQVRATCEDTHGNSTTVRAKYIVGCDGGGSTVRKLAEIPFIGERKVDHWVRIDGIIKTNIPERRMGLGAFESKTHGHVLYVRLDHGAVRIGYVLNAHLFEKYGTRMSAADAAAEAAKAVAPFELEFTEIHWHTVYGIQQHVAERFQDRERILIAGDAAHTHSSGSAQGMNTGMHDVNSLSWRLAGVLKGWYKPEVLANYSTERHAAATQLINNDKLVSALISRKLPESMKGRKEDPMVLLDEVLEEQQLFSNGLGISYAPNLLNDVDGSYPPIMTTPGHRFPDFMIHRNGDNRIPTRLHEITKYNGKFRIIIFTGIATQTRRALQTLRTAVDKQAPRFQHAVDFLTIVAGMGLAFEDHLGVPQFGRAYWDHDFSAHFRNNVSLDHGSIVVLRPDGLLGHVSGMDRFDHVVGYLERLIVPGEVKVATNGHATRKELGTFMSENENNLAMPVENGATREESGLIVR
ncbi:hypothetical protein LTR15_005260 [Elasticomyces elasticus]|nr:hypothetical protein LTR15_005260 [Elasticomyces elasticus]